MRIAAVLEYKGTGFCGWQRQAAAATALPSIQQCVEEALGRVANEPIVVTAAGRTDAGVHALAQVIHFDTRARRTPYAWVRGTNSHLPAGIALTWAGEVADDFHARYSAIARRYLYVILNRPVRPTWLAGLVTHEYRMLDVARMRAAAAHLIGEHDFSAFRGADCQAKSPVRELRALEIERRGEFVFLFASANAFLHHMVRNIAGVLIAIGAGEREPDWARAVLESRTRASGGVTAPPDGLYLAGIDYPERFGLPKPPSLAALGWPW
jgi:tRNA pseudouridine38-40 synthase